MPDIDLGRYEEEEDENGDLIKKDPNDNIIARWDEADGAWDYNEQAIKNLGSLSTEELNNVYYAANFDGAEGGAKIQNALDYAASQPGKNRVVVGAVGPDSPSSAPESDVWLVDQSAPIDPEGYHHTELVGDGRPLLFLGDGTADDILRTATDQTNPPTEDFTIEGIRFDGNVSGNPTYGENNSNFGTDPSGTGNIKGLVGVRAVNCLHWTIRDCSFENCARFGLQFKLSDHCSVENCRADNCDDDGFTTSNEYFNNQDLSDIVFDGIEAKNNGDQGIEIEDGSTNVTVVNSWFEGNSNGGIITKSHDDEQPVENVKIKDCVLWDNKNTGLMFYGSINGESVGRIVDGVTIYQTEMDAIDLVQPPADGRKPPIRDVSITNTNIICDGADRGVNQNAGGEIEDVDIDVDINFISSGGFAGMQFRGPSDNLTLSPTIDGGQNTTWGINIDSSEGAVTDTKITDGSLVENCDQAGLAMLYEGDAIKRGYIGGTFKNNGQDTNASNGLRSGIVIQNTLDSTPITDLRVSVDAYDDQGTATQLFGIRRNTTDYIIYDVCNLRGNATGAFSGTAGTNSIEGDIIT